MYEFAVSRSDGGNGLKIVGELDVATAPQLTGALTKLQPTGEVVLDLSELTFLDSCGVHAILEFANARNGNGPVVILDPSDPVTRVFEILGLDMHPGVQLRRTT